MSLSYTTYIIMLYCTPAVHPTSRSSQHQVKYFNNTANVSTTQINYSQYSTNTTLQYIGIRALALPLSYPQTMLQHFYKHHLFFHLFLVHCNFFYINLDLLSPHLSNLTFLVPRGKKFIKNTTPDKQKYSQLLSDTVVSRFCRYCIVEVYCLESSTRYLSPNILALLSYLLSYLSISGPLGLLLVCRWLSAIATVPDYMLSSVLSH